MTRTPPITGRVVAITGGAQGIGREIAAALAAAGARVAIGDRDLPAAERTAAELSGDIAAFALDVTDTDSFRGFLDATEARLGPIDVLVNNAGVMWVGPFDTEPDAATDRMLAVNLHGVIRGVRLAAPRMRHRGRGHIVTVASAASRLAPPGEASYAASKHGVLGYLTAVREELRGSGVELSMIMPTVVDTELAKGTATGAAAMLTPADVATAVVKVIGKPRFEVNLPGYVGPLVRVSNVLPQRVRDLLMRLAVPNQVKAVRGSDTRTAYEAQVLHPDDGRPGR
ncbi:SDR family oxidoreductase [Gordonia sp. NB41Y]|uniref:SDR family oxidoreductase n=1 Tax=Gordonia sp. NB41Y TaxID=875808 RepID=UPI0006B209DD|nr:SDR family oxidoreductase [Gordonia sp. NB41Y]EMP11953.2 short-chain dehydrogenase [Gordonia sp. NB41Y]WLP88775.1 SDR family oxidoreductase [Gordonia sp. NB41Y]